MQALSPTWRAEVTRLLPELSASLPLANAPPAPWQRQRLFAALAQAVLRAGAQLLLLDDLQWCDAETLAWLPYLMRAAGSTPLLVVGTLRPAELEAGHPLPALARELRQAGQLVEIELGPLTAAETGALAGQVAGRALAPVDIEELFRSTEGDPLFVIETIRALRPGGALIGALAASDTPSLTLPPRIAALLSARLGQLSPAVRDIAELAATIGRSFHVDLLARAGSGMDEEHFVRALDELWRRGIVRERDDGSYDFSHDKLREVALVELSPARRRLLHRRIAAAIEALPVHPELRNGRAAAHYEHAGRTVRAVLAYTTAAERARRVFAYAEAAGHYRRALTLLGLALPDLAPERALQLEAELLEHLGETLGLAEQHDQARETLGRALGRLTIRRTGARPYGAADRRYLAGAGGVHAGPAGVRSRSGNAGAVAGE